MSDINPSLVSSELTTIETFKDTTEKRGSKLTLNELNYISDKQLHSKGGSGGSSSPVGLAKVKFVVDDPGKTLGSRFDIAIMTLPVYLPGGENYTETSSSFDADTSIQHWNDGVDRGRIFLITPYALYVKDSSEFTYTLEGAAEFGNDDDSDYIKITGDCTITIESKSSPQE